MASDIEIAQAATPKPITEIAQALNIPDEALEPYGVKLTLERGIRVTEQAAAEYGPGRVDLVAEGRRAHHRLRHEAVPRRGA